MNQVKENKQNIHPFKTKYTKNNKRKTCKKGLTSYYKKSMEKNFP